MADGLLRPTYRYQYTRMHTDCTIDPVHCALCTV